MSLSCDIDFDDEGDRWWYGPQDESALATKRSRKCCSCGQKISVGDISRKVNRYRRPTEFEEDRGICFDEVPLASWYLCETCGDLADSITEQGLCYTLGNDSLKNQIAEYRSDNE